MNTMTEDPANLKPQHERKRPHAVAFMFLLFIALFNFHGVTQSPRFESYRTLDIVRLVLAGACFGVALVGLIVRLLRPRR
jgi:hypothetical protein